jgi:hypothetical protein
VTQPQRRPRIGCEQLRVIKPLLADAAPAGILDDASVEFVFPQNRDRFALRIIIDAGSVHQRRLAEPRRLFNGFNQPSALS